MAPPKTRKRQTKLSFSPMSNQTRDAHVSYDGSPLKRRRIEQYLQGVARSDGPSSSAVAAEQRSSWPISSTTPAKDNDLTLYTGDDDEDEKGRDINDADSSSSDELVVKTPRKKKPTGKKKDVAESSQVFSKPPVISPKRRQTQSSPAGKTHSVIHLLSSGDEGSDGKLDDTDSDDLPITPAPAKKTLFPRNSHNSGSGNDSDESEEVRPSTQRKSRQSKRSIRPVNADTEDEDEGEDEDEVMPTRSQRLRGRKSGPSLDREEASDDSDALPPATQRERINLADSSSNDEVIPTSSLRRSLRSRKGQRQAQGDLEDAEEASQSDPGSSDAESARKQRRAHDQEKQDEIDEDAEDLKTSTVFFDVGKTRGPRSTRDKRRSRLEQLKALRSGRASSPVDAGSDDDYGGDAAEPLYEDDRDFDDWVVKGEEDDDDAEGLTDLHLMRHAQLKLREHWEYIIRWMLTNRLNPLGAADLEDFYRTSLRRVDNECGGLVDRLMSSAWTPTFTNAVKARPDYEEAPISDFRPGDESAKCSACNRSGHPASYTVRLTGKAYSSKTLEPLKDEDEDDEDEESEDEEGHRLLDENREFRLGTYCRSNAMNAHALIHWRMRLKDWIQVYLKQNGYLKSKRIVERESWPISKRAKLVDEIIGDLKDTGTIRDLWKEFDEKLTAAPNVQGQRYWK